MSMSMMEIHKALTAAVKVVVASTLKSKQF